MVSPGRDKSSLGGIHESLMRFNMVRGTEVHDGLKFQEKYLQRESAKKIFFFRSGKFLNLDFFILITFNIGDAITRATLKVRRCMMTQNFRKNILHIDLPKKICTGKISCFLRDLQ